MKACLAEFRWWNIEIGCQCGRHWKQDCYGK